MDQYLNAPLPEMFYYEDDTYSDTQQDDNNNQNHSDTESTHD